MADGVRSCERTPAPSRAALSRRALSAFGGLFLAGGVLGLVDLISDSDATSTQAGVAVANTVHAVIALVLVVGLMVAWRRNQRAVIDFGCAPFTAAGWRRLVRATIAVPCALAEVVLWAVGRRAEVTRLARWRADLPAAATDASRSSRSGPTFADVLLGVVAAVVLTGAAVLIWYSPIRAGVQVFAAFDPDFTRDAWGGPSYLGASLAHWMDGIIGFYAACALIGWITARRRARLDASTHLGVGVSHP